MPTISLSEVRDTAITVVPAEGEEYALDQGPWGTAGTFSDLEPETLYLVKARVAATDESFCSLTTERWVTTLAAAKPSAPPSPSPSAEPSAPPSPSPSAEPSVPTGPGPSPEPSEPPAEEHFCQSVCPVCGGCKNSLCEEPACETKCRHESTVFTDVAETDWYMDAVTYAADRGLMRGTGDGRFSPELPTNRAMVVTILYRLTGEPETGRRVLPDVPSEAYYASAMAWAVEEGLVSGYPDGTARPEKEITREELAVLLYRYTAYLDLQPLSPGDLSAFEDGGEVSSWAVYAMRWAVGYGLLQGSSGRLDPKGPATRAQTAAVLMRWCETVLME